MMTAPCCNLCPYGHTKPPHDVEKVLTQLIFQFKKSLQCQVAFYRNATEHGSIPGACR